MSEALQSGGLKVLGLSPKVIAAAVCATAVIAGGGALYATGVIGGQAAEEENSGLQYAMEGVVALEEGGGIYDELELGSVALEFRNDAFSKDGQNFSCYLGNSALNKYDMYVAIYADLEMTDLLYLSDLVPPGLAFEKIKLNRALEKGDHRVYVAYTQIEDAKENIAHSQTLFTMDFHVIPG